MRIFVDSEFDGFGGDLISMALVAEDGREWYGVLPSKGAGMYQDWVFGNVIPHLRRGEATIDARSKEEFLMSFHNFVSGFNNPTIVADWPADLVHFFACLLGLDHTKTLAFPCTAELDLSVDGYESAVPHNALYDARAIRDFVMKKAA